MWVNLVFDIEKVIQELGIGEVLILFFDVKGSFFVVEWVMVIVFCLWMGLVMEDECNGLINYFLVYGKYEDDVDWEFVYEML